MIMNSVGYNKGFNLNEVELYLLPLCRVLNCMTDF